MPSHDITFCIPHNHECINTLCVRHQSKAPVGIMLSYADFWNTCLDKKEAEKKFNKYPIYIGEGDGN